MVKASTITPLINAYKKPYRAVSFPKDAGIPTPQPLSPTLSPVLYHGTVRYETERWMFDGLDLSGQTLTADPFLAMRSATYRIRSFSEDTHMNLVNDVNESLNLSRDPARRAFLSRKNTLMQEWQLLQRDQVTQAIALFDANYLLDNMAQDEWNINRDMDGTGLRMLTKHQHGKPRPLPRASMFAVFEFIPEVKARLHVLDGFTWHENFSVSWPSQRKIDQLRDDPLIVTKLFGSLPQ